MQNIPNIYSMARLMGHKRLLMVTVTELLYPRRRHLFLPWRSSITQTHCRIFCHELFLCHRPTYQYCTDASKTSEPAKFTSASEKPSGTGKSVSGSGKPSANKPLKVEFNMRYDQVTSGEDLIGKVRAMHKYVLTGKQLDALKVARYRRSAYLGEPVELSYREKDVKELSIKVHGSARALEKMQQRLKGARAPHAAEFKSQIRTREKKGLASGTGGVVRWAILANLTDAVCKMAGWLLTGSHSMFAECVHSCADTVNQCVLAFGIHTSAQKPDSQYPYGYANVRHVTSLISGVGILFVGTGLNCYHGISALLCQSDMEPFSWGVWLLSVSLFTQGATILRALQETRKKALEANMSVLQFVRSNEDPNLTVVLLEDGAAVGGVAVAAGCIGLSHMLHSAVPDACGSVAIGLLLGLVASKIIRANSSHLLGRSIPNSEKMQLVGSLEKDRIIKSVHDVKATEMGSSWIRFKAEVDFDGPTITRAYLADMDLAEMLKYVKSLETPDELQRFLQFHGELFIDKLGAEVDRIEQDLKKKNPDLRHVDLEVL